MDVLEPPTASTPFCHPTGELPASANNSSSGTDSIWIEKYRPQTLDDVVGNEEVLQRLRLIALEGNMPHLLLAPSVSASTPPVAPAPLLPSSSAAVAASRPARRTIEVVRDRIKAFAKEKRDLPPGRHKIIILDEVDSMTEAAQQALRRIMELHSDTTRFALACNSSSAVIEPLQSRCSILRFTKLSDAHLVQRLREVCAKENVTFTDDGIEALVFSADGDMRNALNNLQSTVSGFGLVNKANVEKVCDTPPPEMLRRILQHCTAGDWYGAQSVAQVVLGLGYTPLDVVTTLRGVLRRSDAELQEHLLLEFLGIVGMTHMTMAGGLATELQMESVAPAPVVSPVAIAVALPFETDSGYPHLNI
ncbi:replication factor c [Cyclospora cayetanensis]|uniref:Replication factor c n=1 Tax=Cyclospora cayetanensis TaxID=88456 RepID=A0A1D3CSX9_9EIME|nr:replication factor c [Cyclospora cayetanensis]